MAKENEQLKQANTYLGRPLAQSKDQCQELQLLIKAKEDSENLLCGFKKLSNMLLF